MKKIKALLETILSFTERKLRKTKYKLKEEKYDPSPYLTPFGNMLVSYFHYLYFNFDFVERRNITVASPGQFQPRCYGCIWVRVEAKRQAEKIRKSLDGKGIDCKIDHLSALNEYASRDYYEITYTFKNPITFR